jgi:ABC-2 type transport system permease protein
VSYFAGKVALVLVSSVGQAVALFGVGAVLFGLRLPTDPGRWLTFGWVFGLGIVACSLLGLAYSSLITGPSAGVAVFVPFTVLQFTSGVYVPFTQLPRWVQQVAAVFPLKWLC